jgi:hypothetical protein
VSRLEHLLGYLADTPRRAIERNCVKTVTPRVFGRAARPPRPGDREMPGGLTIKKGLSRGRHFLFSLFPIFLALLLVTLVTAKAACNYNVLSYFRGAAHW